MFLRYWTGRCGINSPYLHVVMISGSRIMVTDISHATDTASRQCVGAENIANRAHTMRFIVTCETFLSTRSIHYVLLGNTHVLAGSILAIVVKTRPHATRVNQKPSL